MFPSDGIATAAAEVDAVVFPDWSPNPSETLSRLDEHPAFGVNHFSNTVNIN